MYCPVSLAGLGDALAAEVRRRELNVSALARRVDVSQEQLSNWLAGRRRLSWSAIDLVRAELGLGVCELFQCGECPRGGGDVSSAPKVVEIRRRPWRRRVDPLVVSGAVLAFLGSCGVAWLVVWL